MITGQRNTKPIAELQIPNAPGIPGLMFRHYRGADDHALMAGLVNAANAADGVPEASSVETMAHYYAEPKNLDPYRDVLIAEVNGEPACYSRVFWLDQDAEREGKARIYRSVTFMHPAWRRKGLGRAILTYNENRIGEIAACHLTDVPKFVEITVPDGNAGAAVLLKQFNYRATRHFFIMSRELGSEIPGAELPLGLELRPVKAEHYRQIWDAIEEAFLDHWASPRATTRITSVGYGTQSSTPLYGRLPGTATRWRAPRSTWFRKVKTRNWGGVGLGRSPSACGAPGAGAGWAERCC